MGLCGEPWDPMLSTGSWARGKYGFPVHCRVSGFPGPCGLYRSQTPWYVYQDPEEGPSWYTDVFHDPATWCGLA